VMILNSRLLRAKKCPNRIVAVTAGVQPVNQECIAFAAAAVEVVSPCEKPPCGHRLRPCVQSDELLEVPAAFNGRSRIWVSSDDLAEAGRRRLDPTARSGPTT